MDEVIQLAEPINRGRIDPRNINLTGSLIAITGSTIGPSVPIIGNVGITGSILAVTGSTITNTQPVGITGSITQGTTPWQVTYTGSQPVTFSTPIGVTQSTTPWTIGGTVNLTGSNIITGSLTSGSFVNAFITNLNPMAITGSTIGPIANITGSVKIFGTGSAQIAEVLSYAPSGTENAVVTRNIPSGTQAISASQTTSPWIIAGGVGLTGSTN